MEQHGCATAADLPDQVEIGTTVSKDTALLDRSVDPIPEIAGSTDGTHHVAPSCRGEPMQSIETSEDDLLNENVDSKTCVPTTRQHLPASHYLLDGIYPQPSSTLRDAPSNADSPRLCRVPPPLPIPRDRSDISSVTNMSTLHEANRTASANAYDRWLLQKIGTEKHTSTMSSPGDAD